MRSQVRLSTFAVPRQIADLSASASGTHMPGEIGVFTSTKGATSTSTAMRCSIQTAITFERRLPAPAGSQIQRHVELIAALEMAFGIFDSTSIPWTPRPQHGDERRSRRGVEADSSSSAENSEPSLARRCGRQLRRAH
jgi:hypothetical protein